MKILLRPLIASGFMVGALCQTLPSQSQPIRPAVGDLEPPQETGPVVAETETLKAYEIAVNNVPAHLMAYWLDPANQKRPTELKGPHTTGAPSPKSDPLAHEGKPHAAPPHAFESVRAGGLRATNAPFALPGGIESIVPDDARKVLLISGTEAGVQALRDVVTFLDRPLRRIELETHVLAMGPEDIKAFGLDFGAPPPLQRGDSASALTNFTAFATVHGDLTTLLASSLNRIPVPSVLAINNLSAVLHVSRSHPVPPELQDQVAALTPQGDGKSSIELQTPLQITLTPTINNDDSLTMLVNINGQVQLGRKDSTAALKIGKPSELQSIINFKDGDTIAVRGLDANFTKAFFSPTTPHNVPLLGDIPMMSELFRSQKPLSGEVIVLITSRIVRRPAP